MTEICCVMEKEKMIFFLGTGSTLTSPTPIIRRTTIRRDFFTPKPTEIIQVEEPVLVPNLVQGDPRMVMLIAWMIRRYWVFINAPTF